MARSIIKANTTNVLFHSKCLSKIFFLLNDGARYGHRKLYYVVTFALNSTYFARHSDAVFLVVCDPSLNEL